MNTTILLKDYKSFKIKAYKLEKNQNIKNQDLLKEYGVYVISDPNDEVVYIGKAGTIKQNGSYKKQNISKRLKNIRDKQDSNDYFKDYMEDKELDSLTFTCIVTVPTKLPGFVEADLVQKFFDEEKILPLLNKSF